MDHDGTASESIVDICEMAETLLATLRSMVDNVNHSSFKKDLRCRQKPLLSLLEVYRIQQALTHSFTSVVYFDNALTPVNQLPPSVLSYIFLLVQGQKPTPPLHNARSSKSPASSSSSASSHYNSNWIFTSHVCKYWRATALSTPQLWTRIPIQTNPGPEVVHAFISRSYPLPITVICTNGSTQRRSRSSNARAHSSSNSGLGALLSEIISAAGKPAVATQRLRQSLRAVLELAFDRVEGILVETEFPVALVPRASNIATRLLGPSSGSVNPSRQSGSRGMASEVASRESVVASPGLSDAIHRTQRLPELDLMTRLLGAHPSADIMHKLSLHGRDVVRMFLGLSDWLAGASSVKFSKLVHLELIVMEGEQESEEGKGGHHYSLENFLGILGVASGTLKSVCLVGVEPTFPASSPSPTTTDSSTSSFDFVYCSSDSDPKNSVPLPHTATDAHADTPTRTRTIVALPSLTRIELGSWSSSSIVAHFLAHLRIPGKASRCVWGEDLGCLKSILFGGMIGMDGSKEDHHEVEDGDIDGSDDEDVYGQGEDESEQEQEQNEHDGTTTQESTNDTTMPSSPSMSLTTNVNGFTAVLPTLKRVVLASTPGGEMVSINDGSLYIHGAIDFSLYYPLFRDMPATLALSTSIEELVIAPMLLPPSFVEEWRMLLECECFRGVKKITIRDVDAGKTLGALGVFGKGLYADDGGDGGEARTSVNEEDDHLPILLPNLESLDIQYSEKLDTDLTSGPLRKNLLGSEFTLEPITLMIALSVLAERRAKMGVPIRNLKLRFGGRVGKDRHSNGVNLSDVWNEVREMISEGGLERCVGMMTLLDGPLRGVGVAIGVGTEDGWTEEEERLEREKEKTDEWYLVMRTMMGVWPTEAYRVRMRETGFSCVF